MNKWLFVVLISVVAISLSYLVFAQEEETEYSFGTVIAVNELKNEITISEYDWMKETEVKITYSVNANTKFYPVTSLKEIAVDDEVEIDYIISEDGKKIATYIGVSTPELEEESQESEEEYVE